MDMNDLSEDKANILIVDDRADKLIVFKTVLEDLGDNLVMMRSGEEALLWLLKNDCAVILLDINMPGMDGFETAQLVRSRPKSAHIPIIFITGHAQEVHAMRGYSLGAVDYILSPVLPVVLRSKVAVFVQLFKLAQQIQRKADERVALAHEQAARAAAEESMRDATFLAEASKILGSSLDVNSVMVSATTLLIPKFGDISAIALSQESGMLPRVLYAPKEEGDALGRNAVWLAAVDEIIKTGQPRLIEDYAQFSKAASCDANVPPDAIAQLIMVPLMARGKVLGTLSVGIGPARTAFDPAKIALVTDIAGHVGMALDNCLLFKEIQDANQRNNEFLATLSHELRNPLAPMRNAIYSMHLAGLWTPDSLKFKGIIERQLEHMTHLVDDLLDVARITRGKIQLRTEQVDLVEKIHRVLDTCRPLMEKAGHHLKISMPPHPVWTKGDRVRLQQIFENILGNAIKYTDPRGHIEVSLKVEHEQAVTVIQDTGVGIAADMIPRIWEMFVQVDTSPDRTRNGLGIGLSLARQLVHLHGGSIECTSPGAGKGSTFTVRLPTVSPGLANVSDVGVTQSNAGPSIAGRILIVDDNQDSAQSLGVLLGKWGHDVELAYDGPSALEIARTFRPELVFLDIGMPRMNGYEVARRLREDARLAGTRFIVLSGYGAEVDHIRSKEAGFDHHLVKPVDPRRLPEVITSVLSARQHARHTG